MKLFGYEITVKKVELTDDIGMKPMLKRNIFGIVQRLIHRNCGNPLDEITPESTPFNLSLDSLDEVELMMAVEEEFGIDIEMVDWEDCRNVGEVVKLVNKILMEK